MPQVNGWRWALAIGLIPAIYSFVIRIGTPESVRFLESVGKHEQARGIVERFEASPAFFPIEKKAEPTVQVAEQSSAPTSAYEDESSIHSIWSSGQRRKTIALCVLWFCIILS